MVSLQDSSSGGCATAAVGNGVGGGSGEAVSASNPSVSLDVMPAMLNDTLASLSGRIAANYLLRQNQQQTQLLSHFGSNVFRLPDDLKVGLFLLWGFKSITHCLQLVKLVIICF